MTKSSHPLSPARMVEVLRSRGYTRDAAEAMVREAQKAPTMKPLKPSKPSEARLAKAIENARRRGYVVPARKRPNFEERK